MSHGAKGVEWSGKRDVSPVGGHGGGEDDVGETPADYPSALGGGAKGVRRGVGIRGVLMASGAGGGARPARPPWPHSRVLDYLAQLSSRDGKGDLGDPPLTRPTVGVLQV